MRVTAIHDRETGLPNALALKSALQGGLGEILTVASIQRFETIRSAIGTAALAELMIAASGKDRALTAATIYRVAPDTLAWVGAPRMIRTISDGN